MTLRTVLLEFYRDPSGVAFPKDRELHKLAVKFAEENLVDQPNYAEDFLRVWVVAEFDDNDNPISVQGVLGYAMRPDVTLCRALNRTGLLRLHHRVNAFFADNGIRGQEALVYVNPDEDPRQKCPEIDKTLEAIGAKPANRWSVTVK